MEYVYAALILNESGEEINEDNLKDVLEAADAEIDESRVKALVAALEDVDIDEAVEQAAAVPTAASAPEAGEVEPAEEGGDEEEAAEAEEAAEEDEEDEDEEASGEGLGELFG